MGREEVLSIEVGVKVNEFPNSEGPQATQYYLQWLLEHLLWQLQGEVSKHGRHIFRASSTSPSLYHSIPMQTKTFGEY